MPLSERQTASVPVWIAILAAVRASHTGRSVDFGGLIFPSMKRLAIVNHISPI
jgi:hypothetical protein